MDNFDYKKYLSNNPLTEAYTPGEGWIEDFEYDDMLAHGLTLTADNSIEDLRKVAEDFTDVNYHREGAHLYDAIDAIEAGDRGEAKMYINKFRKEIKTTLAGWDDVNEAEFMTLTADQVEMIAQSIADEFTAEDSELDLKYVITPGSIDVGERGAGFDLDVEAGPNTPGAEWKDERGFSIANYLGDYAGGSFYIKDGKVFNAANRNSFIANASDLLGIETPGEETDYMQRRKEMDDYAVDENKENKETKNTKMKKSELKEMIKAAMMAEGPIKEDETTEVFTDAELDMTSEMLMDMFDKLGLENNVEKSDALVKYINAWFETNDFVNEAEKVDVKDDEEVDIDIEKDIEIDDVENESDIEVDSELAGEDSDVAAILGLLTKAQEEAKSLGDEKLMDQIGNTITYYTRAHVVAEVNIDVDIDNPAEDAEIGMELEEGAADNLEIKSLAKTLYSGFKKMGADVELTASKMRLNKRPSNGNLDSKDVFIYAGDEAVEVNLVGEKAGGFFDKIQKDFPKFEFKDRGDSKTWEDKTVKNLAIYPGKGMSEALNEEFKRFQKLAGIIK